MFVCSDPYCMYLHSELHLRPTFAVCLFVQNTSCMEFSHIFNITNSSSRKCSAWVPVAIPTLRKDIYIALRPLWMILHTLSHYIDLKQNAVCSCSITYVVTCIHSATAFRTWWTLYSMQLNSAYHVRYGVDRWYAAGKRTHQWDCVQCACFYTHIPDTPVLEATQVTQQVYKAHSIRPE